MATARLNHAAPPQALGAACKGPRRLPRPPAALQADAGGLPQERVAALVRQQGGGAALYATGASGEALSAAVADLVATNASQRPAPDSLTAGQGTWEVGPVLYLVGHLCRATFLPASSHNVLIRRPCLPAPSPCRCSTPPTLHACRQCWVPASSPSATPCEATNSSQMWVAWQLWWLQRWVCL
jgi:hypothetical protein